MMIGRCEKGCMRVCNNCRMLRMSELGGRYVEIRMMLVERCVSLIAVRKGEFVGIDSYMRWGLKIAMGQDE